MFLKDPVIRTELEQYHVWYELRKGMLEEGRDFQQITNSERQTLENLALQYFFTIAGKKAVAYLDFNEDGWFIPPAYESDHVFAFRAPEEEVSEGFSVNVYPNPGSVLVNFEIENNLNIASELNLIIYDSQGRIIHNQIMKDYKSVITIQTSSWASGLYSYSINSDAQVLTSKSFEIVR